MPDPWERLSAVAADSLDLIWYEFAKSGEESAILAPLASYTTAAIWLSESMSLSDDSICRKIGAMLAGFIDDPEASPLLMRLLQNERERFALAPWDANSVGEDIMFAATRWIGSAHGPVREGGIEVLSRMVADALEGVPWNTANWAAANLFVANHGRHPVLDRLMRATASQLEGNEPLKTLADSLRSKDQSAIVRLAAAPSPLQTLSPIDARYEKSARLWTAAADTTRAGDA